jgi:hypothetical protein
MSNELMEKVAAILKKADMPDRHTFFQLKNFIINKEYTVQGQLWAIIRELKARQDSVEALEFEIEEGEDHLAILDISVERANKQTSVDEFWERERALKLRSLARKRKAAEKNVAGSRAKLKNLLEEVNYLVGAFEKLSTVQEMKPLDDIGAQKEYWNEKCAEELNLRLLLRGNLDSDLVRTILALDDDSPVKQQMVKILNNVQQQQIEERDRQRAAAAQISQTKQIKKS